MIAFSVIHIFRFGTAQIVSDVLGKQVPVSGLANLDTFVSHIKGFKPEGVVDTPYHVIHVFNGREVRYLGKCTDNKMDKLSFSVKWSDVNISLLESVVNEIANG